MPTPKAQQDCGGTCEDPNHGKRHCDEPIPQEATVVNIALSHVIRLRIGGGHSRWIEETAICLSSCPLRNPT